ncbi:hypothetical protein AXX17_AT1G26460 [Arabidopsis thaliana]|uniref:Uncharacterized protein n=1 Tax=Arabidopsis thaliana TaxID=3702 RepID=A0A178W7U0_ARATH|nr:hypothetical protein AXX17_AT1G26460 [Arabidopsis thaliana]
MSKILKYACKNIICLCGTVSKKEEGNNSSSNLLQGVQKNWLKSKQNWMLI